MQWTYTSIQEAVGLQLEVQMLGTTRPAAEMMSSSAQCQAWHVAQSAPPAPQTPLQPSTRDPPIDIHPSRPQVSITADSKS